VTDEQNHLDLQNTRSSSRAPAWVVALLLTLAIALCFGSAVTHDFVDFDDPQYVAANERVNTGLSWQNVRWAFTSVHASYWLPVTWLSLMIDCSIFGPRAGPLIAVNIVHHAINTLLLGHVLALVTGSWKRAWLVAALFALHPLRVESVVWVTERKDTLSTLLGLLAVWAHVRFAALPSLRRYALVAIAMTLSLMAKPMLVTLPVLLLLLDYWPLRRFGGIEQRRELVRCVIEKVPLTLIAAIAAAITIYTQRGAMRSTGPLSLLDRVTNSGSAIVAYLHATLWPWPMAAFYPLENDRPLWLGLLCVLVVVAISVSVTMLAVRCDRYRFAAVGWWWFVISILPVSGLLQSGGQFIADRFTYVPHMGLFVALVWSLPESWLSGARWRARVTQGVIAALLLACCVVTAMQVPVWQNAELLWTHAMRVTDRNYLAVANLGRIRFEQRRWSDSVELLQQAASWNPQQASTFTNLSLALSNLGRYDEAVTAAERAVKLVPDHVVMQKNLAQAYLRAGRLEDAANTLSVCASLAPSDPGTWLSLAMILQKLNRHDHALDALSRADSIAGRSVQFRQATVVSLLALARNEQAELALRELASLRPEQGPLWLELANAWSKQDQTQRANAAYRKAVEQLPDSVPGWLGLGDTELALKRPAKAIVCYERVLVYDPQNVEARNRLQALRSLP
jgi:protein O-mannosyl-transferase